jgi:hypothetical protein
VEEILRGIMKKKTKKIAILGTTPTRMMGPINDPEWEIWTIGPGGKDAHRWDRLFEVHNIWPKDFDKYLNDLSNVKPPQQVVTMQPMVMGINRWAKMHNISPAELKKTVTGEWSANVIMPRNAMIEKYRRAMWFSSSIAWLIPLAIEEGATDIGLWGIDLESGEEYISQFVGCAHFIDLAELMGIRVHMPDNCGLKRDPSPYPDRYETLHARTLDKKKQWLSGNLNNTQAQYDSAKAEVHRHEGMVLLLKKQRAKKDKIAQVEQELLKHNINLGHLNASVNQLRGELNAIEFLQRFFVWGMHDTQWMDFDFINP